LPNSATLHCSLGIIIDFLGSLMPSSFLLRQVEK
jgi:hypothetical protein